MPNRHSVACPAESNSGTEASNSCTHNNDIHGFGRYTILQEDPMVVGHYYSQHD